MAARIHTTFTLKLLLPLGFLLLFLLILTLRPMTSSPPEMTTAGFPPAISPASICSKIPDSLADTIVHYATSNTTPQQTAREIAVTARVLRRRSPCRFLVFGLGLDSPMWSALNHGGRTVFLEEDEAWMASVSRRFPELEAYHVRYDTKVRDAAALLEMGRRPECSSPKAAAAATAGMELRTSACGLALKGLPEVFYEEEWDLIMVDAPTGWTEGSPGRMGAIYTAAMAARGRRREEETEVFVHDVDREVEDEFSRAFLCEGYLKEEEGRLRRFSVPSHRGDSSKPFCPSPP